MTGEQKPGGLEVAGHVVWWKEGGLSFIQAGEPVSVGKSCRVEPVIFPEPAEARIGDLEARVAELLRESAAIAEGRRFQRARATAAEAKLARAVEGLERIAGQSGDAGEKVWSDRAWLNFREYAAATLAALQQEGE